MRQARLYGLLSTTSTGGARRAPGPGRPPESAFRRQRSAVDFDRRATASRFRVVSDSVAHQVQVHGTSLCPHAAITFRLGLPSQGQCACPEVPNARLQPLAGRIGRSPLIGASASWRCSGVPRRRCTCGTANAGADPGPPGIGKSRLLDELTALELAHDLTVLRGGASQAQGMPPYLPLLQALGEYIAGAPAELLWSQLGQHADTLATLFPEIEQRSPQLGSPRPIGAEQERYRLFEALVAFLDAMTGAQPVVLLIDDLQWVDPATCDALVYVLGRLQTARCWCSAPAETTSSTKTQHSRRRWLSSTVVGG